MKAKRVSGEVFPVYLSAHHVNAMLAAFDEIIEADPENTVSRTADKLKTKVLQHGRTFYDCGEHSVSIYLFPSEIIPLIKILLMMLTFRQPVETDYYPLIGKVKKQRLSPEKDTSFFAGQRSE